MSIASELRNSNYKSHQITYYDRENINLFIKGLEKYLLKLQEYKKVEADFGVEKSELELEVSYVEKSIEFLKNKLKKSGEDYHIDFFGEKPVSEVVLRLWKAALIIEKEDILIRRAELISKSKNIPSVVLEGIDQKIAQLDSSIQMGLFSALEPYQLMVKIYNFEDTTTIDTEVVNESKTKELIVNKEKKDINSEAKTTIIERTTERIIYYDDELRGRISGLFSEERVSYYDTALREVGTIIEDRIRRRSQSPKSLYGEPLIEKALHPGNGKLIMSKEVKDRQSFFNLIKGFIGYIRNPNSHHLSDDVARERVIQVTGFADYILFIIENSELRVATETAQFNQESISK